MWPGWVVLMALGGAAVIGNLWTMRFLWASQVYEPWQKFAQTVVVWLFPGSFIVVLTALRGTNVAGPHDPTAAGGSPDHTAFPTWMLSGPHASGGAEGEHAAGHHGGHADTGGFGGHDGGGGHDAGGGGFDGGGGHGGH